MGFWMVEWRIECHSPHPSVRAKEAHTSGLAGTGGDLRSDRVHGRETGTIRSFTVGTGGTIGSGQEPVRVNNLTPPGFLLIYPLRGGGIAKRGGGF